MILVDYRAGSSAFLEPLKLLTNGRAESFTLDSGDFAFSGSGPEGDITIGVELKTISEFMASARSGRVQEHLDRMRDGEYDLIYILIYGVWRAGETGILEMPGPKRSGKTVWVPLAPITGQEVRDGKTRKIIYQASELHKFVFSLQLFRNVNILRAVNKTEVAWYVAHLYQYFQKPWDAHSSVEEVKLQSDNIVYKASWARRGAFALPGVGKEVAKYAEGFFGSRLAMDNASIEEWAEMPVAGGRRFGRKKAETVWKAIREDKRGRV